MAIVTNEVTNVRRNLSNVNVVVCVSLTYNRL
jgi:hypothetical protein